MSFVIVTGVISHCNMINIVFSLNQSYGKSHAFFTAWRLVQIIDLFQNQKWIHRKLLKYSEHNDPSDY